MLVDGGRSEVVRSAIGDDVLSITSVTVCLGVVVGLALNDSRAANDTA